MFLNNYALTMMMELGTYPDKLAATIMYFSNFPAST
jgi:hypothetical protein